MISASEFDVSLMKLEKKDRSSDGVQRWDVKYPSGAVHRQLSLYVDYNSANPTGSMKSLGVRSGENGKYKNKKHSVALFPDVSKPEEYKFVEAIDSISKEVAKVMNMDKIKSPVKIYESDGEKKLALWCRIIEANDGRVFTKAYGVGDEQLDVLKLQEPMSVRPMITLTLNSTEKDGYSLKCNLREFCVFEVHKNKAKSVLTPSKGF
eukprot:TRINITY_DN904_c0_g1_i15.p2 TRINITY_DN904_c0_g1~~TRINITY_DN904_c0_g1_i15.p2  ORF type:complete len:207 (+),score=26.65 TRINITY_DN904_c0_g1_i15:507-1127(+)